MELRKLYQIEVRKHFQRLDHQEDKISQTICLIKHLNRTLNDKKLYALIHSFCKEFDYTYEKHYI